MASEIHAKIIVIRDKMQLLTEELFVLQALNHDLTVVDKIRIGVAMESLGLAFKKMDEVADSNKL